jgi:hypothetical protein
MNLGAGEQTFSRVNLFFCEREREREREREDPQGRKERKGKLAFLRERILYDRAEHHAFFSLTNQ